MYVSQTAAHVYTSLYTAAQGVGRGAGAPHHEDSGRLFSLLLLLLLS